MQLQIFISLDISNSSNNTGKELSNNYRINLPFQNLITCFVSSNSVTQGNHNYVSLQHKMLVKCAVQVNQRYEEINLTQFLLLMNFSISCELLSVACAGQAEQLQQQLCCLSLTHVKRARGECFCGELCPLAMDQNTGFWCDGCAGVCLG